MGAKRRGMEMERRMKMEEKREKKEEEQVLMLRGMR
jgi:hypothetical protein